MSKNIKAENNISHIAARLIATIGLVSLIVWIFIVNIPLLLSGDFSFWNVAFVVTATFLSANVIRSYVKS